MTRVGIRERPKAVRRAEFLVRSNMKAGEDAEAVVDADEDDDEDDDDDDVSDEEDDVSDDDTTDDATT